MFPISLFAVRFVIRNVTRANPNVTAIFPVALTPRGLNPKI